MRDTFALDLFREFDRRDPDRFVFLDRRLDAGFDPRVLFVRRLRVVFLDRDRLSRPIVGFFPASRMALAFFPMRSAGFK